MPDLPGTDRETGSTPQGASVLLLPSSARPEGDPAELPGMRRADAVSGGAWPIAEGLLKALPITAATTRCQPASVDTGGGLRGFQLKAAAPPHPVAGPDELAAAKAQTGAAFVASVEALVKFAQARGDDELLRSLRWMRAALQHWLDVDERAAGQQREADLAEVAAEVIVGFRMLAELGVRREDVELLSHLRKFQAAWIHWAESGQALAVGSEQ